jgi:predicted amidohydrolase
MIICVAQTRPVKGNITANIAAHTAFIDAAVANGANMVVFPELSLTGYEPMLAASLAIEAGDTRLNVLQTMADEKQVVIGVGTPLRHTAGICIGMIIMQPGQARQIYSKKYLHADELPFFVSGENLPLIKTSEPAVALAICYELSIAEHAKAAAANGASVYIASVAKSAAGAATAAEQLAAIARRYGMLVLMSNSVGYSDNFYSAGQSAIWNRQGEMLGCLDDKQEGLLCFDTITGKTTHVMVQG